MRLWPLHKVLVSLFFSSYMASLWLHLLSPSIQFSFPAYCYSVLSQAKEASLLTNDNKTYSQHTEGKSLISLPFWSIYHNVMYVLAVVHITPDESIFSKSKNKNKTERHPLSLNNNSKYITFMPKEEKR